MRWFKLEESSQFANKFLIKFDYNQDLFPKGITGSYHVLVARVLNLDYVDYLRFARDVMGAELIGKGKKYVVPFYMDTPEVNKLLELLNERMKYILKEREDGFTYSQEGGVVTRTPIHYYDEPNRTEN